MMRDDNSVAGASSPWEGMPRRRYEYREEQVLTGGTRRKIAVTVKRLPENVYLAVSEDVPGMTVEGKTRDEVADEAREVTKNLLELAGEHVPDLSFVFIFYD
jgi:predicted RNase H-like HicB family nuclease